MVVLVQAGVVRSPMRLGLRHALDGCHVLRGDSLTHVQETGNATHTFTIDSGYEDCWKMLWGAAVSGGFQH